jgi:hypothetical protein
VRRVVYLHAFTSRHFRVIAVYVIDAGKTEASRSQTDLTSETYSDFTRSLCPFAYKNRHLFAMCFSNQDVPPEDDYTYMDRLRVS